MLFFSSCDQNLLHQMVNQDQEVWIFCFVFGFTHSPCNTSNNKTANCPLFVFSSKVDLVFGPVLSLLRKVILSSFPSADRHLTTSRPSVFTPTIGLATQTLTFLLLVLANKSAWPQLSIMRSRGSAHAAKGTRHGGLSGRCVVQHKR